MPPFCRSRWVQPRTRRVARCESCASSTCSLPSKLRARCAKISKIKPLRSNTRRPVSFSRLRSWLGVKVWSTSTTSAVFASAQARISSALPDPTKYLGSGRARDASTEPTPSVPAEAAKAANSAVSLGSTGCPIPTPTRTARSPPRGRSNNCRAPPITRPSLTRRSPVPSLRHPRRSAIAHCARARRWKWHVCRPSDSRYF